MNYAESIHYLYNKLPMFSRSGVKAYKADLKNTRALCNFLGNPEKKIKTIHVAGTNGKGSVSHMLAATLQQNGYKTGLYTSPHLKDFRERIKINGKMIGEEYLVDFVEKTKEFSEKIKPSFFELTFVMALDYFTHQNVDVAVIETGLGGRLDSTNIITPLLSVITNVSFDHMDILGNTLQKIAYEKAGIIKEGIPVVVGERNIQTDAVFESKAKEMNAPIFFAADNYTIISSVYRPTTLELEIESKYPKETIRLLLDLNGIYQEKNITTALAAMEVLKQYFFLQDEKAIDALGHVKQLTGLSGRWDVIQQNPTVVLDVAHNEDGIRQLISQLAKLSFSHLHVIFGMVKDKDIKKVLCQLPEQAHYYFTKAHNPRSLSQDELLAMAKEFNLNGETFSDVNKALKAALKNASTDDLILVCGSVFVIAEVENPLRN